MAGICTRAYRDGDALCRCGHERFYHGLLTGVRCQWIGAAALIGGQYAAPGCDCDAFTAPRARPEAGRLGTEA